MKELLTYLCLAAMCVIGYIDNKRIERLSVKIAPVVAWYNEESQTKIERLRVQRWQNWTDRHWRVKGKKGRKP